MEPKRIQRKRVKGWRMPAGAVYVGRPTKWGNPFAIIKSQNDVLSIVDPNGHECGLTEFGGCTYDPYLARKEATRLFKNYMVFGSDSPDGLDELRGKDLACWCPLSHPCHADVLLELANQEATE